MNSTASLLLVIKPLFASNWYTYTVAACLTSYEVGLWLADFPYPAPDLCLTDGHLVGKLFAVGQPTRPTQPPIPLELVNE